MHGKAEGATPGTPLTARDDLRIGDAVIRPSRREVRGLASTITIEPRVMQVLLALSDAGGAVVAREALMAQCWPGQTVGDDALGRAVFEVRRALRAAGIAGVSVETIPKSGYRLAVEAAAEATEAAPAVEAWVAQTGRRAVLAGGALVLAGGLGLAAFRLRPDAGHAHAAALVDRATIALREGNSFGEVDPVAMLREAVRLAPDSADAWGKLALALKEVADTADRFGRGEADTRIAARRALTIDPAQPDARLALATVAPLFGDWFDAGDRLQRLVAEQPRHEATPTRSARWRKKAAYPPPRSGVTGASSKSILSAGFGSDILCPGCSRVPTERRQHGTLETRQYLLPQTHSTGRNSN